MAQCQKSGSRAEKFFLKKRFSKNVENGKKRSYMSMLGSNLLLIHKKTLYCKFLKFAVSVDVTDILQTSKHNSPQNMSNLVMQRKIFVKG